MDELILNFRAMTIDDHYSKKVCSASDPFTLLHDDLIFEILSWLPAKCLTRYKTVCKLWCMIIKSRKFVEKHMQQAKPLFYYDTTTFLKPGLKRHLFCYTIDGLILEGIVGLHYYTIRNHATNWEFLLPVRGCTKGYMSMSYLPSIEKYKVSSINITSACLCVNVFTVGVDDVWKPVDVPFSCLNRLVTGIFRTLEGVTYMLLRNCHVECCKLQMVIFENEDERFVTTLVPRRVELLCGSGLCFSVIEWNNKFGIWYMREGAFHIWVLQDYKKGEWDEIKIVLCSNVIKQCPDINKYNPYKVEGNKLFMQTSDQLWHICYDFKSEEFLWGWKMFRSVATSLVDIV